MSTQFRSYEVARKLFSVLSSISWAVIALGGYLVLMGIEVLGGSGFGPSPYIFLVGGTIVSFLGLISIGAVQYWRAGVDTAEYTQQMLQVARDQLEVSNQSHRQGQDGPAAAFADALKTSDPQAQAGTEPASYSDPKPPSYEPETKAIAVSETPTFELNQIEQRDGKFIALGQEFASFGLAADHLIEKEQALEAETQSVSDEVLSKD